MKKVLLVGILCLAIALCFTGCDWFREECDHAYDGACDPTCNECGERRDAQAHQWKDATCTTLKTCTVCGTTEGEMLAHDWEDATCITAKTCKTCGATEGSALGHKPAEDDGDCTTPVYCTVCGDVTTPAGQHTPNNDDGDCTTPITCSVCGTTTTPAKDNHTGGTATCTAKAVCTECGTAYGTVDANNHIDENTEHVCDRNCGKTDIGTHADSAEDNDHVCDYGCGATLEDHKGGIATCVSGKLCEICGVEYDSTKNPDNHASTEFTYTNNGDGTHTKTHKCGVAVGEPENHDFGSGNTCICGAEIAFTGIDVVDERSDEYRYDETSKTYTIIIPANEVGSISFLSYDIIGTNLNLIEETNTLLKVEHISEDGTLPAPDDLLVDVLQNYGCFGWSVSYRDGEWEQLRYTNDGGLNWTTYTFEVKQAYSITVNASQNGTVTANEYAIEGDNIALNVSPAEGYMLDTLSVTDASGNTIVVENNQFTMPASAVTVNATFAVCDHKDSRHETATDNDDGTHSFTCTVCGVTGTENHTLTYSANGNIITESCSADCGYSETATISATDATYDGLEHNTATVDYSEGWKGGVLTVSHANHTNAGTATASITIGEATATVDFKIEKATVTVTADAISKTYGDEDPELTYTANGLFGDDALTGNLTREEGENVGSYAITLGTLSAENYTISFEGADFTIQAKEVTEPIVTLDQTSYQYDGNVKEPKVTSIVVDGRTLKEGIDYTVSYENNVYIGNYATVVINFMGNYDGTFRKWFKITQDPKTTEFDGEWVGNGELPESLVSQTTNGSTGYDLSLPMHAYQSVPETETPAVEFVGQQLDIGGGISMKFYVRNNEDRPLESIFIEVEFVGKLTYLTECEKHPTEDKVYIYTFEDINPQCLGDLMNVTILVGGSPLWHENAVLMGYSAEKNLLEIRKTADDLTVQLIDDLLAYGKAASEYKKHDTMAGDYTVSDSTIPDATVTPNGAFTGYTVVFGQVNFIKVSVALETGYTLYLDGTDITSQLVDGIFKTDGIAPTEFDKKFSFEIKNGDTSVQTFAVSVNDYIGAQKDSATMGNLVKALYNYGYSAKVYQHLSKGDENHLFVYTANEDGTHTGTCVCGEEVTENHRFDKYGNCACGDSVTPVSNLDELKAAVEQGGKILLTESIDVSSEELGLYIYTDLTVYLNGRTLTGDLGIFNVLSGATLTTLGDGTLRVPVGNGAIGILNGTVNIAGGVIEGIVQTDSAGTLKVSGSTIDTLYNAGICVISGGEISYLSNYGTCTISSSTTDTLYNEGTCTINGSEISNLNNHGTCTINDGTFGFDPTEYVDTENYTVTDNGDGTWTVTAK